MTTAGELNQKVKEDTTKYDPLEVGHALSEDFLKHLEDCAKAHEKIFDGLEQFCVVFVMADDPLLDSVTRRKFYGWPFLPKPRPRQGCFLYTVSTGKFKRLWILPQAATMAHLSCTTAVDKRWKTMKEWSDAFYNGTFHELIREQNNIKMLSEQEYLKANGDKIGDSSMDLSGSDITDTLEIAKVKTEQVVNSKNTGV